MCVDQNKRLSIWHLLTRHIRQCIMYIIYISGLDGPSGTHRHSIRAVQNTQVLRELTVIWYPLPPCHIIKSSSCIKPFSAKRRNYRVTTIAIRCYKWISICKKNSLRDVYKGARGIVYIDRWSPSCHRFSAQVCGLHSFFEGAVSDKYAHSVRLPHRQLSASSCACQRYYRPTRTPNRKKLA